jgi:LPS sulfotransferase NodH
MEAIKSNQRFIILSQYRAGSTMLCRSLDKHPELTVAQEILHLKHKKMIEWRKPIVEKIGHFTQNKEFVELAFERINGFKIMLPQLPRDSEIWNYLISIPDLKIIFLERINVLESMISFKASMISDVWQKEHEEFHNINPFYIDPKDLECELENLIEMTNYYSNLFRQKDMLCLQYEKLIYNWKFEIANVQKFIGVEPISLDQDLKKLTNNYKFLVINYKELMHHFKKTKFKYLFDVKLQ